MPFNSSRTLCFTDKLKNCSDIGPQSISVCQQSSEIHIFWMWATSASSASSKNGPMELNTQGHFLMTDHSNHSLRHFAEMKSPVCQYSVQNSFYKLPSPAFSSPLTSGTPHGITDILSRPLAAPNATVLTNYPQMGGFGSMNPQGMCYSPQMGGFSKSGGEYPIRSRNSWDDMTPEWRIGHQLCDNNTCLGVDASSKKKHTRPTFTGHQIFALEKTFEQTKYLAGPERARLAYSLGMTESQVKVWFQNRRTKWRKKSTVDPTTATRASMSTAGRTLSENEDDEYNKPLDPDSDDEKIRLLLRKHRAAFSVLSFHTHNI
ncbi:homeobox protein Nkx-6.3 isoform X1 [Protopterus annectens]|uniref:homeobox protein Nkx-6.3 isoform X1 n=1 Tax=Protopterus annectens TaxID=7888 RepID=UPI001CFB668E|nr:homeobox protein Nkx-6.3 isoform X1 [Protopterus annectens]